MISRLHPFSVFRRGAALFLVKAAAEVQGIGVAQHAADLADGVAGALQEKLGAAHAE